MEQHRPEQPFQGAVRLVVRWCFPLDKKRRHRYGEYKTSRPDTDNLEKLLKDCMTTAGFWKDDALEKAETRRAANDVQLQYQADTATQRAMWLMVCSIADAYGFGPKRLQPFFDALQANADAQAKQLSQLIDALEKEEPE